jgi:sulfate adenylyltransferase
MEKSLDSKTIIEPYGSELVHLLTASDAAALRDRASRLPSLQLSERALCDLEVMAVGGFSPLCQFMGKADVERVLEEMRLADGTLFPIPVTLPVEPFEGLSLDIEIALRDRRNDLLGVMRVEEIYEWSRSAMAVRVAGTTDLRHPLVSEMERWGSVNIAGPVTLVDLPKHYDFQELRHTPRETRNLLAARGHANVIAFQTRNPLHRVHEELTKRAVASVDGTLLLHPVVGMTRPGDVDHFTRVRTYRLLAEKYYEPDRILLSLLPIAMRMAGPREALWHAIIRRNYGANHLIVGRDHASPGVDSEGRPFYGPYDAQELMQTHEEELGVKAVPFAELQYLPDEDRYEESSNIPAGAHVLSISGTQVRDEYLAMGKLLPDWFTRPEVAEVLREAYPPRHRQGFCVWFTGLSGSGKSTTAEILTELLLENGRQSTVLDGDVVRTHLSKGLGFSKEDRDANILRIGFVAAEIVRHGGVAICAAVSPYRATREAVRKMMPQGQFVEVFVDTPLKVCEQRDSKGMYAKARRGEIKGFTGIDDPYEAPVDPEITLETTVVSAEANAREIVALLRNAGFLAPGVT